MYNYSYRYCPERGVSLRHQVQDYFREDTPPTPVHGLLTHLRANPQYLRGICAQLVHEGVLRRTARGLYAPAQQEA